MQPRGVMVAQVILVHFVEVRILTGLPFFFAVMGGKRRALLLRRSVTDHAVRSLSCSFVKPGVSSPIIGKNEFPCAWRPKKAKHIPTGWQRQTCRSEVVGCRPDGLSSLRKDWHSTLRTAQGAGRDAMNTMNSGNTMNGLWHAVCHALLNFRSTWHTLRHVPRQYSWYS